MINYPKKYVSEKYEKFIKKDYYKNLLNYCKEFYPEVFNFKNLKKD